MKSMRLTELVTKVMLKQSTFSDSFIKWLDKAMAREILKHNWIGCNSVKALMGLFDKHNYWFVDNDGEWELTQWIEGVRVMHNGLDKLDPSDDIERYVVWHKPWEMGGVIFIHYFNSKSDLVFLAKTQMLIAFATSVLD